MLITALGWLSWPQIHVECTQWLKFEVFISKAFYIALLILFTWQNMTNKTWHLMNIYFWDFRPYKIQQYGTGCFQSILWMPFRFSTFKLLFQVNNVSIKKVPHGIKIYIYVILCREIICLHALQELFRKARFWNFILISSFLGQAISNAFSKDGSRYNHQQCYFGKAWYQKGCWGLGSYIQDIGIRCSRAKWLQWHSKYKSCQRWLGHNCFNQWRIYTDKFWKRPSPNLSTQYSSFSYSFWENVTK